MGGGEWTETYEPVAPPVWRSASSAKLHSALTSRICSTVLQRAHSSRGEQTMTASARAREIALQQDLAAGAGEIQRRPVLAGEEVVQVAR